MRNYYYLVQLVIEGFQDLEMYHLSNVEVVYLYMDAAKTVAVPPDFVDWIKVGIPLNGKFFALTKDESMLRPGKFPNGAEVGHIDSTAAYFFTDHFHNGRYVSSLYGLPGGINRAYYRYDEENRQFLFSGSIPRAEIVLEYISSGIKLSGTTIIPRIALPVLQRYVFWQRVEDDPRVPDAVKERKQKLYLEELEKVRFFETAPTIEEYKDSLYRSIKQGPKR